MYFQNVESIIIENLTFKNSRYWSMYFIYSAYGRVSNIHFESDSNVPNQDGVDMGKGTHNFIVEKITGCVGDNIIAINESFGKKRALSQCERCISTDLSA